ncbi:hypothetical protein DL95DRAFT_390749 [Leptodontidium sp. 2 PMI_412]|nr:hypothetical protein DL95DRAFT_390749 [Leptodontidium sp. 2 PMI_412]
MSRYTSPVIIDGAAPRALEASSTDSIPNIFGRMMSVSSASASPAPAALTSLRDLCQRPPRIYNELYNPYTPESDALPLDYSPYVNGQPLFDDREVDIRKMPRGKSLAPVSKKAKRS